MESTSQILEVEGLRVYYWMARGAVRAVDGVSFGVNRKERFGLVGESGCGKSTTAMSILRLIKPPGSIEGGRILFDGLDITQLRPEEMRSVRWAQVSLILQGAMNSLNPVMRVKDQIADAITAHYEDSLSQRELRTRIVELLSMVELPRRVADLYPHELSGGMKQRVCIAMATALGPQLIVADEPTSALDVVVQKAVMEMLIEVQERLGSSLILIGHDMGLQAQVVDRLGVMYAGRLAEVGNVYDVYDDPLHPYTQLLIASLPSPRERKRRGGIAGLPPALLNPPPGCIFHPRCPQMMDVCRLQVPEFREIRPGRLVACHLYNER
jgi:peptide/nickel transport system ATP-binding protein